MRRIQYVKGKEGPVIVKDDEINPKQMSESIIERYNNFFQNAPLYGGKEWRTLNVDEIVSVFFDAVIEIRKLYQRLHDDAVSEHSKRNYFMRFCYEFYGWEIPNVPSQEEIIQDMVNRCRELSNWMASKSSSSFYMDSDMSDFMDKPIRVVEQLLQRRRQIERA